MAADDTSVGTCWGHFVDQVAAVGTVLQREGLLQQMAGNTEALWGKVELVRQNDRLKRLNQRLKTENERLKSELEYLKTYPSIAQGLKGEKIIARLTGGVLTGFSDPHDVQVKNGDRIEVKMSRVNVQKNTKTRRWSWADPLGRRDTKDYDWLVLIGEKDLEHEHQYPADLAFVFFLVPRAVVDLVKTRRMVALNTNLATANAEKSVVLKRHLVRSGTTFNHLFAR